MKTKNRRIEVSMTTEEEIINQWSIFNELIAKKITVEDLQFLYYMIKKASVGALPL